MPVMRIEQFHILTVFILLIMLFVCSVLAFDGHSEFLSEVNEYIEHSQWTKAEAELLLALWKNPSGQFGIDAAKLLARVNVIGHKAPQAMEWLETALANPEINAEDSIKIADALMALQRIYLTGYTYSYDSSFETQGIDFESPRHLVVMETGDLVITDRYRLVVLSRSDNMTFRVRPPTSPIPDKARTLKLFDDVPVIVTDIGYWFNNRLYSFQAPTELSRIVDAVYTKTDQWFVIDRRNTHLLIFDHNRAFTEIRSLTAPTGDEKLLAHPLGGSWSLMPASRLIKTLYSPVTVTIPFRGPGYHLSDPVDFATDWFGHLYVLNQDKTVAIFSPKGVWLKTIDPDPRGDILRSPSAIAVDNSGTIFIADRKRHNVYCFR
jgi:hypothetical protein